MEAFWLLIEDHHINQVSVKELIAQAHCNRATFYYHFKSTYDLLEQAIATELVERGQVIRVIFDVLTQPKEIETLNDQIVKTGKRVALILKQGGAGIVEDIIVEQIKRIWATVLCCKKEDLTPKSCSIIRYAAFGMLGIISQVDSNNDAELDFLPINYFRRIFPIMAEELCHEQNVAIQDIGPRLTMINNLHSLESGQ